MRKPHEGAVWKVLSVTTYIQHRFTVPSILAQFKSIQNYFSCMAPLYSAFTEPTVQILQPFSNRFLFGLLFPLHHSILLFFLYRFTRSGCYLEAESNNMYNAAFDLFSFPWCVFKGCPCCREGIHSSLRLVFYFMSLHFTHLSRNIWLGHVWGIKCSSSHIGKSQSKERSYFTTVFLCYWLNFGFMVILDTSKLLSSQCAITIRMINGAFYILVFEIQSGFHSAAF